MPTLKALFGLMVFANIYRLFVLRVLHVAEDVFVCLPFKQLIAHSLMTIISSIMKSCPLSHILSVNVGSTRQEQSYALSVSFLASKMQRSALLLVNPFELSPISQ